MYDMQQIVDWVIARNRSDLRLDKIKRPITSRELNTFLYFAQGLYMVEYDTRMFDDEFYAHSNAPVAGKFAKAYPNLEIPELNEEISDDRATQLALNYDQVSKDKKVLAILENGWQAVAKSVAFPLTDGFAPDADCGEVMTRLQVWREYYHRKDRLTVPMDDNKIKDSFARHLKGYEAILPRPEDLK